ncbi:MAG: phosphoglycerate dehydrogenase [Candidatus Subteraquimicrobiales bacterium]|nr:phosphoglycerate dehydrogenase [Candidatus Subteraquimicrobiales bacterium]
MKVLVKEKIAETGVEKLKKAGFQVDVAIDMSREEMLEKIGAYDGLIVRSATKVDEEVISKACNMKVIGRAGVGVDNIDVPAATKRGIIVANAPESNIISVAEHTIALLLALARHIPRADVSTKQGKWEKSKFEGVEVQNKVLGIVGVGRIGTLVASRARGLGMKVIGHDPYVSKERFQQLGIEIAQTLPDLLKVADFISIHLPKTKETLGLIGEKEFNLMKDGVRLVNTARGGIVDENALVEAIKSGKVAGAGVDVYNQEPYTSGSLLELGQVILTPHIAASTREAQDKAGIIIAEQVVAALKGEFVSNAVNIPIAAPETLEALRPFLPLTEILGKLYVRLLDGHVGSLDIDYAGELGRYDTSLLTVAVLKGIFESATQEPITYVNAPIVAKERGVEVRESKTTTSREYVNLIALKGEAAKVSGTLLGADKPRIVGIYDYEVDVIPSQYMLIIHNEDKPGMIGKIGTIMGNHNINIARMQFGRKKARGDALSILSVDEVVPDKVLKELEAIDGVNKAKFILL